MLQEEEIATSRGNCESRGVQTEAEDHEIVSDISLLEIEDVVFIFLGRTRLTTGTISGSV